MERIRFEFVIKAMENDPKTNVLCITSLEFEKHTYLIPEKLQPARLHEQVIKTQVYLKLKDTIHKRHDKRQVWIRVTPEIRGAYMDEDGNMQFKGYLLEECDIQKPAACISEEAMTEFFENFNACKKETGKSYNIKKLTEKFVLQKFNKKTSNVTQWLDIFEMECTRMSITEDSVKIEALRLFLEDSSLDWYSSMLIKYTLNSEWSTWKENFCETFADRGWSPVRYAILFKYRQGSLMEYALKKEKLLLEINKTMDSSTLIDLIATGLPNFIADKIDRCNIKETKDLFNNIRGLEHLANKKYLNNNAGNLGNKNKEKDSNYKPCRICEKENKGSRYHPESLCWFKNNSYNNKREHIRTVNNSELETELNEIDPKN
ncbi:uncharacterized protein LOC132903421 [Amyelois transitella]|uniref:uncharacterized protein LOC132903421 n=1 Tax=Amyelois transitella TaxID=680683 RepID=UPI0029900425|nr:uncharacterized protein LOC132903421 [Amyelois transitella]